MLLITGDFNSRTSNCKDYVIYDQHLDTNGALFVDSFMMPKRYNTDTLLDDYGKRLLHICKSTDMIIANGRTGNDKTYWISNIFWPKRAKHC